MRTVLIVILFAGLGAGIGFWKYCFLSHSGTESFEISESEPVSSFDRHVSNWTSSRPSTSPASIEVVDGRVFDFGTMQKGTSSSHPFKIRNTGGSPVDLKLVRTSCKCSTASFETSADENTKLLLPGEETDVVLTWNTNGVSGEFGQTATIQAHPLRDEVILTVKGFVAERLEFDPPQIFLGDIWRKDTIQRSVRLFSNYATPLTIKNARWRDPTSDRVAISHTVRKLDTEEALEHPNAQYVADFRIEILPGMPIGTFTSAIIVDARVGSEENGTKKSDDENTSEGTLSNELTLDVAGRVVGDVQFIAGPSYNDESNIYTIGDVDATTGTAIHISLACRSAEDDDIVLTVGDISPKDAIQVTIGAPTRRNSRQIFRITISVPKGAKPIDLPGTSLQNFGKIIFLSNLSDHPNIPLLLRLRID